MAGEVEQAYKTRAEQAAKALVETNNEFPRPRLNVKKLMVLTRTLPIFKEDVEAEALRKALDYGLFSLSSEGNFSLEARLFPGFLLNPKLEKQVLYFTVEGNCEQFEAMHPRETTRTISIGEYPLPTFSPLTVQQWKEIIAKTGTNEGRIITTRLIDMGVLDRKAGLKVMLRFSTKNKEEVQKNVGPREGDIQEIRNPGFTYFRTEIDARNYREAYQRFVDPKDLSVEEYNP